MKKIFIIIAKNLGDFINEADLVEFSNQFTYEKFEISEENCEHNITLLLQSMEHGMQFMIIREETYKNL